MTTDLEWRYEDNSNQIYAWKKQQQAARAFDPGLGRCGEAERERGRMRQSDGRPARRSTATAPGSST